jgi:hypothetical protein
MDSMAVTVVPDSGRRLTRRSAAQWRVLVDAFEQSGMSRRAFCTRHGVSASTFGWWRSRLGTAPRGVAAVRPDTNAVFVELSAPVAAVPTAAAWDLELELGAGVVLRLRRGGAC